MCSCSSQSQLSVGEKPADGKHRLILWTLNFCFWRTSVCSAGFFLKDLLWTRSFQPRNIWLSDGWSPNSSTFWKQTSSNLYKSENMRIPLIQIQRGWPQVVLWSALKRKPDQRTKPTGDASRPTSQSFCWINEENSLSHQHFSWNQVPSVHKPGRIYTLNGTSGYKTLLKRRIKSPVCIIME